MPDYQQHLQLAADFLRNADHVVAFTGAGISAESGIPTFRDDDGFWQRYPPEHFATWDGLFATLTRDPDGLIDFLLAVLEPIVEAAPNPAHVALAQLERHVNVTIITQNVDALHQEAGSTVVKEIHGTLFETVTLTGSFEHLVTRQEVRKVIEELKEIRGQSFVRTRLPLVIRPLLGIGRRGPYRPNLVLFGDGLNDTTWEAALAAVRDASVMLTVGTSGEVMPAATLPREARAAGARLVTIDPEVDSGEGDICLQGRAGDVLPQLVNTAFP